MKAARPEQFRFSARDAPVVLKQRGISSVLAVSPHPDDVAFSAGVLLKCLAEHFPTEILTVFDRSRWIPNHNTADTDVDTASRLRIEEDRIFCSWAGVGRRSLSLEDAGLRGYDDRTERGTQLQMDNTSAQVCRMIDPLLRNLDRALVLGPAGIGGHVDHCIVRDAVLKHARHDAIVLLYDDLPYADGRSKVAGIGAYSRTKVRRKADWLVEFSEPFLSMKLRGAALYRSQIRAVDKIRIISHGSNICPGRRYAEHYTEVVSQPVRRSNERCPQFE